MHWFGTDAVGRDLLSRVLVATRLDMSIAIAAVALSFAIGSAAGTISGYLGGWVDTAIGRVTDTIMAFPLFVLAMGIVAAAGNTVANIIYATAVINIPTYVRVARAEVLIRREAPFVQAARLAGNGPSRLLAFHLFPNVLPPLIVQASLNMGYAILNAAGLSFIGLGVRPPTPEWGIMVADGAAYIISGEWWVWLFPGLALTGAVLSFNVAGDGLRDFFDPQRR
jgi:peptide/nickel transport system permease protein